MEDVEKKSEEVCPQIDEEQEKMTFCQNCGYRLDLHARFCSACGHSVINKKLTQRKQKFAGEIIKCPNCGEALNAFVSQCPSCGYELRDSGSSDSIKEFEQELKKIEAERQYKEGTGIGKEFAAALGANTVDSIDEQLADRISNFIVPNTREDVFEFMILAASNIDPMAYDMSNEGYAISERKGKMLVSNAWKTKYNQVHQKAKIMFPEDLGFHEIESLYEIKQKQIRKAKSKMKRNFWFAMGALIILVIIGFGIFGVENYKEAKLEKQLNATVEEIQEDIDNGDYDDALIKVNGLRFDESLNSKKAEQWDEQREFLLNMIDEKKGEN